MRYLLLFPHNLAPCVRTGAVKACCAVECVCVCAKDTSFWTGTYLTLHFSTHLVQRRFLARHVPFFFFLFIPPHSCPWEFSHGIMLLETFPLCIHVTRLAVTGCYCVSLKWCRCYQFHCWLWMLNMWIRRGGWGRWCWGLTASGSWSARACKLLQLIFFFFFFLNGKIWLFLWPPCAFLHCHQWRTGRWKMETNNGKVIRLQNGAIEMEKYGWHEVKKWSCVSKY